MGQHIDELEIGKCEDDREQGHDQDERLQQWQSDIAEALPTAGAVDRRRLVEFGRYGLQPGEERDAVERQATPGVDEDNRAHRERRVAEPGGTGLGYACCDEEPVE